MKKQVRWTRWHRYDDNGIKQIKRFENNVTPNPLQEEGYTAWVRGTGAWSEEHYNNIVTGIRAFCKGVPKSDEQKEKMRQAKLNKPKTEEHKQAMRDAWQRRRDNGTANQTEEHKKNISISQKKPRQDMYRAAMAQLEAMRSRG